MAASNLIGQVLDGKYRIDEQLGKGGMGAVYSAIHLGTERPVALKVIAPQLMQHSEFVERFRREARAAGRLQHPNVVDVTDFGFAQVGPDQLAYLVMEYLDGSTLSEILAEEPSLPLNWVIDILEQTCAAVEEAHRQGIIHRDLKPENIWLEPNHRGGYTIKVLDFGIAKLDEPQASANVGGMSSQPAGSSSQSASSWAGTEAPTLITDDYDPSLAGMQLEAATQRPAPDLSSLRSADAAGAESEDSEAGTQMLPAESIDEDGTRLLETRDTEDKQSLPTNSSSSLTRVGSILGTPLYMSPEQCRGESLGPRSDIYSLGVIAYRLLSGETPFKGDQASVMKQHRESPPPPLVVKRVPTKVSALIMSALAKNPDDRPSSAAGFAGALRAHSSGVGTLLRNALTVYSEHLPTFVRLALLVYAPLALMTVIRVILMYLASRQLIPKPWDAVANTAANIVGVLVTFFAASVVGGITTWLVSQLLAVPLRPLLLRPAFAALKKRLWPYLLTGFAASLLAVVGLLLCVLPGVWVLANLCLVGSVLIMEDLRGLAAMKRSRELYQRSRKTVIAIVLIHIGVPLFLNSVAALLLVAVVQAIKPGSVLHVNSIVPMVQQFIQLPLTIFFSSLASVVTALLYWKTRLAGGERLKQALVQFSGEGVTTGRGKMGLTTRARTSMRTR
ncbi:MAG TPA: protein kinase [Pyrinomonadaceae bacterium]|nr:protein kinase [Pyrinomonadaceae bacterium]